MNWPAVVQDALDRADRSLVGGGYHAVSVSTERVRTWLRFRGWVFVEPGTREPPALGDLDLTARRVVDRSANLGAAIGGTSALGGAALVPPEAALSVVVVLRMVQRLCVVYGFELESDRGRDAAMRALAAVWSVDLPPGGVRALRVSDVPRMLRGRSRPTELGASLVKAMARGTLSWAGSRVSRYVPVLSAPAHAADARRELHLAGDRAIAVLRRLAEVQDGTEFSVEEAVVVR